MADEPKKLDVIDTNQVNINVNAKNIGSGDAGGRAPDAQKAEEKREKRGMRDRIVDTYYRFAKGGAADSEGGNTWLAIGLVKHILVDGIMAWLLGYGAYNTVRFTDVRFTAVSMIFFVMFWAFYLKGWKLTEFGMSHVVKTFLICVLIYMLDTWLLQAYFFRLFDGTGNIVYDIFGIFINYTWLWPFWALLPVFSMKTKLQRFFGFLYIAIFTLLLIGAFMQTDLQGLTTEMSTGTQDEIAKYQEKAKQNDDWWSTNYIRFRECVFNSNVTACDDLGKPSGGRGIGAVQKNETILLKGGIDEQLNQKLIMKLDAVRNAPSNVWERQAVASANFEATAGVRDIVIDLYCGLKDAQNKDIANTGYVSPRQSFVRYQNLVGTFEPLTCTITKPYLMKKGSNTVYFRAEAVKQLELDAYLVAYFIKDEELSSQLNYYLSSDKSAMESFLTTRNNRGVAEAQKEVYARLYKSILVNDYPDGRVESKSEVGFIKSIIVIGEIPIIGLVTNKEVVLQIAVENMITDGKIIGVTAGTIEIPEWLEPVPNRCELLDLTPENPPQQVGDVMIYRLADKKLGSITWKDVKKGETEQKKLSTCTFKFNLDLNNPETLREILPNPSTLNPKVIQLKLAYDYMIEDTGVLTVNDGDLTKVQKFEGYGGSGTVLTKPVDEGVEAADISEFGLIGFGGRPRDGVLISVDAIGMPVRSASGSGTLLEKGCVEWWGNYVMVRDSNQLVYAYGHLNESTTAAVGASIAAGEQVGTTGTTAGCLQNCDPSKKLCGIPNKVKPSLHFGIYDSAGGSPLNPYCDLYELYGGAGDCPV